MDNKGFLPFCLFLLFLPKYWGFFFLLAVKLRTFFPLFLILFDISFTLYTRKLWTFWQWSALITLPPFATLFDTTRSTIFGVSSKTNTKECWKLRLYSIGENFIRSGVSCFFLPFLFLFLFRYSYLLPQWYSIHHVVLVL